MWIAFYYLPFSLPCTFIATFCCFPHLLPHLLPLFFNWFPGFRSVLKNVGFVRTLLFDTSRIYFIYLFDYLFITIFITNRVYHHFLSPPMFLLGDLCFSRMHLRIIWWTGFFVIDAWLFFGNEHMPLICDSRTGCLCALFIRFLAWGHSSDYNLAIMASYRPLWYFI